ncbi:MAG: VOC family protein [Planctomycetes bacterium]|nr:VOC family protein [Planctomycetota bacterium]
MRFDHIAIACRDVERMLAWYQKVLGFQVRARKSPSRPDAPETTYLAGPAGSPVVLELMPDDRLAAAGRKPFTRGLSHLALAIDAFDEWERRLSAAGVEWLGGAVEAVGGGKLRSFLDPEGNMLQIVERR